MKLLFVPKDETMDIKNKLGIIVASHDALVKSYHLLGTRIAQLTADGCIDAKEHWRDGKYLYYLYPMKGGQRKKKYIGNHPLRIVEAQQKLKNHRARLGYIIDQVKIADDLMKIERTIMELLVFCRSDLASVFAGRVVKTGEIFSSWSGVNLYDEKMGTDKVLEEQLPVPNISAAT